MSVFEAEVGDLRRLLRFLHLPGMVLSHGALLPCNAEWAVQHLSMPCPMQYLDKAFFPVALGLVGVFKRAYHVVCSQEHFAFRKETNAPQSWTKL